MEQQTLSNYLDISSLKSESPKSTDGKGTGPSNDIVKEPPHTEVKEPPHKKEESDDNSSLQYSQEQINKYKDQTKVTATQARRAAIISRNMSHNLGSHVMAYLKQKFQNREAIENSFQISLGYTDYLTSYLVGVGKFIGYLQERQDYIANVAKAFIPIATPVDFKDAIFDCLNHDLKHERHPTIDNSINILLSYIALSEGYHRHENDKPSLNIIFEKEDGRIVTGHNFCDKNKEKEASVDDIRSFKFSLPGGIVGRQALFSIIENLIRNAAKHEQLANATSLNISLSICDGKEINRFWCYKEDKKEKYEKYYNEQFHIGESSDISDLIFFTISYKSYQKGDSMEALVRQLREGMVIPYVDDDGNPDERSKGLKEIRISAAWLRGSFNETDYLGYSKDEDYSLAKVRDKKAPLVYITGNRETGDLYFTIFLKKCHEVAFLAESMSEEDIERFRKNEWREFLSKDELNQTDNTFEHIVVANRKLFNELRPFTTNRLTCIGDISNEMRSFLEENNWDKDSLLRVLYSLNSGIPIKPNETIYIWDNYSIWNDRDNPKKQEVEDNCFKLVVRTSNGEEYPKDSAEYVYKNHHESSDNLRFFLSNQMPNRSRGMGDYAQIIFVEGISGGNSTHRLVRHVDLSSLWYYSHLHAMKKRVAIFDERLYRSIHHISEADALTCCKKNVLDNGITMHSRSVLFSLKGIHIFSLISEENDQSSPAWAIVGCKIDWENKCCLYQKFASIVLDGSGIVECKKFADNEDFNFDYISIHQGLLDKLYDSFHFKNSSYNNNEDEKDMENEKGKFSITNAIYNSFMATPETITMQGGSPHIVYNSRLFIHSGRGVISHENMPQPQPFIQYSAIEHAVYDCKYTLVELLDHSKYFEFK